MVSLVRICNHPLLETPNLIDFLPLERSTFIIGPTFISLDVPGLHDSSRYSIFVVVDTVTPVIEKRKVLRT
jgi:hypothetical protein